MRWWEYYYEALGTMNITKFAANVKVLCTVKGGSRSSTAMKHIQNEFTLQNGRKDVNPDCILCETEKQTTDIVRRGSIIAIQGKMKKKMMMMMSLLLVVQIMQKDLLLLLLLHQLQSKIQGISGLSLCFSFSTIR
jgi:hypothetical protein